MYETDDPRSRLSTASGAAAPTSTAFGSSSYARFYASDPQETAPGVKTWLMRGQNFITAYSQAEAGAVFDRVGQEDEYVLMLHGKDTSVTLE